MTKFNKTFKHQYEFENAVLKVVAFCLGLNVPEQKTICYRLVTLENIYRYMLCQHILLTRDDRQFVSEWTVQWPGVGLWKFCRPISVAWIFTILPGLGSLNHYL